VKTLSVDGSNMKLSDLVAELQRDQEEITILKNEVEVARIVPEPVGLNALEMFSDIYGVLSPKAGQELSEAMERARGVGGTLDQLKNPWAS
jgi:antitoxin (DNA-binding transcriptional repressor) of toxin-antitoxin stability system